MSGPDRLQLLLAQSAVTGIDFVYVHENQVELDVYFLRDPSSLDTPLVGDVNPYQVVIYSPATHEIPVVGVDVVNWRTESGRHVMHVEVNQPGDFTRYRLRIDDSRIDPYFVSAAPTKKRNIQGHNDIPFSFKANCKSDLDCKLPEHPCPPEDPVDYPVDYSARDYESFRKALLDLASQRYPQWKDRLGPDAGIMVAEVLSALGDEFSYYQDRIAREAYLETATQRRSMRKLTRLVDYPLHDGTAGTAWMDITVKDGQSGNIPAGADVTAHSDKGVPIVFEAGRGLKDIVDGVTFSVHWQRNSLLPHIWDEDNSCLPIGATEMYIKGHHAATLPLDDIVDGQPNGWWVILRTDPSDPSITSKRLALRLTTVEEKTDPLVNDPVTGHNITRLGWESEQALPKKMDMSVLTVRANIIPAIEGKLFEKTFAIGPCPDGHGFTEAVERLGAGGSTAFRFSLPETVLGGLAHRSCMDDKGLPEIRLTQMRLLGGTWQEHLPWEHRPSFVGIHSSQSTDRHYVLEDGNWGRVVGYHRQGVEVTHSDYASAQGFTVRFGDGEFGLVPARGTVFKVQYRMVNSGYTALAADSIRTFEGSLSFVESVTNPLPVSDKQLPQTLVEIRFEAPEAWQSTLYHAVRDTDYEEAAERLPWVQRAGCSFRWTGSWQSALATVDPKDSVIFTEANRRGLKTHLNRFRQTGRDVIIKKPVYADLDLTLTICVAPEAYPGETKEAVLKALVGKSGSGSKNGFFAADNFTFGTSLHRSALEACVQSVPGVRAVQYIYIRRRGRFAKRLFKELIFTVGPDEVIRLENDPLHPERGSLKLIMKGGA